MTILKNKIHNIIRDIKERNFLRLFTGKAIEVVVKNAFILAKEYGQFNSAKSFSCVDKNKKPIPWYTYPAIDYLNNLDLSGKKVLEYGSGNSSLYYLRKGAEITCIEDEENWFNELKKKYLNEEQIKLCNNKKNYVERIEINISDIIVIDGSYRPACAKYLISQMKEKNFSPYFIIFDNSDWFPNSIKALDEFLNWHRIDFCGFGPINDYTWVTSIYLNPKKKLERVNKNIILNGNYNCNLE